VNVPMIFLYCPMIFPGFSYIFPYVPMIIPYVPMIFLLKPPFRFPTRLCKNRCFLRGFAVPVAERHRRKRAQPEANAHTTEPVTAQKEDYNIYIYIYVCMYICMYVCVCM
jgi:hypothetical protein